MAWNAIQSSLRYFRRIPAKVDKQVKKITLLEYPHNGEAYTRNKRVVESKGFHVCFDMFIDELTKRKENGKGI